MAKIGQRPDNATGTQDTTQTASQLGVGGQQITITQPTNDNDVTTALSAANLAQLEQDFDEKDGRIDDNAGRGRSRKRSGMLRPGAADTQRARSLPPRGRHSRSPSSMSSLRDRAGMPKGRAAGYVPDPKNVSGSRTWGNWLARGALGGLGALAGGIGGLIGGSAGGAALSSWSVFGIPVAATIAGGVGALAGGAAGWKAGTALADYFFVQPQKEHIGKAIDQLRISRGEFNKTECENLGALTDSKWRKLLHVPSSKGKYMPFKGPGRFTGPGRVKDPERRQKIRQALVRHIAVTGDYDSAKKVKATLIATANEPDEKALDVAIARDRIYTIRDGLRLGPEDGAINLVSDKTDKQILDLVQDESQLSNDKHISAYLVEGAAMTAANLPRPGHAGQNALGLAQVNRSQDADDVTLVDRNEEAHRRAAYAVVAHQAQYATSADDFMLGSSVPGGASLSRILDQYDEGYLKGALTVTDTENGDKEISLKQKIASGPVASANVKTAEKAATVANENALLSHGIRSLRASMRDPELDAQMAKVRAELDMGTSTPAPSRAKESDSSVDEPQATVEGKLDLHSDQAVTNFQETMDAIVGRDDEEVAQKAAQVPHGLRDLVGEMADAAYDHAPENSKGGFERLAVFHGLFDRHLYAGRVSGQRRGVWEPPANQGYRDKVKAEGNLRQNERMVRGTFLLDKEALKYLEEGPADTGDPLKVMKAYVPFKLRQAQVQYARDTNAFVDHVLDRYDPDNYKEDSDSQNTVRVGGSRSQSSQTGTTLTSTYVSENANKENNTATKPGTSQAIEETNQ